MGMEAMPLAKVTGRENLGLGAGFKIGVEVEDKRYLKKVE